MKAARLHAYTDNLADVRVDEVPVPQPAHGQVLVRMTLSPVNPSDLNFVHGTYEQALSRILWNQDRAAGAPVFFDPQRTRPCPQPPFTLGGEGVGVAERSGGGFLARRLIGKRVAVAAGPPLGAWAQWTVVDAKRCVVLPDTVPDEQASMFFVNPLTAHILVNEVLRIRRGEWLLITAAGSALGKSVVRMAKRQGFRTLCVIRSNAHTSDLSALGADAVVETDTQDLLAEVFRLTGGRGVAHAIDCVGGELTANVVRCLGLGGRLVIYGTLANAPVPLPGRDLMMPVAAIEGFLLPNWLALQTPLTLLKVLRTVKQLMGQGVFDAEVGQIFNLDQVADALSASVERGRAGKILIRL